MLSSDLLCASKHLSDMGWQNGCFTEDIGGWDLPDQRPDSFPEACILVVRYPLCPENLPTQSPHPFDLVADDLLWSLRAREEQYVSGQVPSHILHQAFRGHRIEKLQRARKQGGALDGPDRFGRGSDVPKPRGERVTHLRPGQQLERRLHDDAQRAESADVKFRHIVPGHVLDDLSSGSEASSVGPHDLQAQGEIASGPVGQALRPAVVRGQHASDRGLRHVRRIEREHLVLFRKTHLEFREREARLHGHHQVVRRILHQAVQPGGTQDDVRTFRDPAQPLFCAPSPRDDG